MRIKLTLAALLAVVAVDSANAQQCPYGVLKADGSTVCVAAEDPAAPRGDGMWPKAQDRVTNDPAGKSEKVVRTVSSAAPPAKFDHPYTGELIIKIMDNDAMFSFACSQPRERSDWLGCAQAETPHKKACTVYLRDDAHMRKLGYTREIVLRHEIGHCNGWKHQ